MFEWFEKSIFGANATAASVNLAPKLFINRFFPPSNAQNSFYAVSFDASPCVRSLRIYEHKQILRAKIEGSCELILFDQKFDLQIRLFSSQ